MRDRECVILLQRVLPLIGMRWEGFRKVRRQVCGKLRKRMEELGIDNVHGYLEYIEKNRSEYSVIDPLCRVTISRFFRDRGLFTALIDHSLPRLAEKVCSSGNRKFRIWSAGSASGEEAYTLKIIWERIFRERYSGLDIRITGTDADPRMVERAEEGCYGFSSLRELPDDLRELSFDQEGERYLLKRKFREGVEFQVQDIRSENPPGPFQVILCRYLVFTYFNEIIQTEILKRLWGLLPEGGILVTGCHETLPPGDFGLSGTEESPLIYRKVKP